MRGVSLRRALALAALFSAGVASAGELQVSVSQMGILTDHAVQQIASRIRHGLCLGIQNHTDSV